MKPFISHFPPPCGEGLRVGVAPKAANPHTTKLGAPLNPHPGPPHKGEGEKS